MADTPTRDDAEAAHLEFWREHYRDEPYVRPGERFEYYEVAYRVGWQGRARYPGRSFAECEAELRADYERHRGACPLTWEQSRDAVRAAWRRLDTLFPDSD